tara:strand:+ start:293 stop:427 length:135 start_codon:yes stop_codon:yes gene_type:complete
MLFLVGQGVVVEVVVVQEQVILLPLVPLKEILVVLAFRCLVLLL